MTQYLFLWACHLVWYFKKIKKTIQVTIIDAVAPQQTIPDSFGVPDNILSQYPDWCLPYM